MFDYCDLMPEGDTIYRAAAQLRKVLDGEIVCDVTGRWELPRAASLNGRRVDGIETRGKHLLMHFERELVLHSHMGMTGSWHIYRPGEAWQKSQRSAAIVMNTDRFCVVCFSPKLIELVTATQLRRNEYLHRLGPDLLGPKPDEAIVLKRFRSQNSLTIGEVVMNQTVVSGIGNVYKSEILFAEKIHPLTLVRSLSADQIKSLVSRAISLMRLNLNGYPRRTKFSQGENLWVYGRRGAECFHCGTLIEMLRQGDLARSTYFCPSCQAKTPDPTVDSPE